MSDSIFLLGDDGVLTEVSSTPYDAEADLQELLADHVDLLPGAQINRDSPRRWLLIKREAGIPTQEGGGSWWSVDHLVVDQDAVPTFVEVKRASDTRAHREVVAQMLDYAANGSAFWRPGQLRAWFEGDDPEAATEHLAAWLESEDDDPESVDMIVTRGSALAGATSTKDASCAYQLNPVRGATDQLGLLFGQVAASQVAQQPLRAFAGACFHTDLMRGIELTAEALGAVAVDISSRAAVTATDLLSAPVPAVCTHRAGRLVHGVQPGIPVNHGFMQLAWLHGGAGAEAADTALGNLDGTGTGDAATLLDCDAGGVAWPQIIAFYAPGPTLLSWAYLTDFNLHGIQPQENALARRISYHDGGIDIEWSTQDNGDPGAISSLDYSATLRLSGAKIVASNLVGTTERQTLSTFLDDLRRGDQAAASRLAAPGVGAEAASQFRSYPSALAATPRCYGLGDLTIPAPLAALIDAGGPAQVNPDTDRLCALASTDPGATWVALGMRRTGFRTWQILWSETA